MSIFPEWQIWSRLSGLKLISPYPSRIHSARLDPEVPPRNDPASDVMGKMIRDQVTKERWKVFERAKNKKKLKDYLHLDLVTILSGIFLRVFVAPVLIAGASDLELAPRWCINKTLVETQD